MRKIKLQMQISLDGFIAGLNGEMDWMVWDWDDKLKEYVKEITEPVDTIILGRNLAQDFIPHWTALAENPETNEDFVQKMVETPKVVFSKTLTTSEWKHTVIASGDLTEEIQKLKNADGNDIIVYGGGKFVSSLIKAGLIDEFHLFVNPAILGEGMTIFKGIHNKQTLTLVKSMPFDCGVVVLNYEPKHVLSRNSA